MADNFSFFFRHLVFSAPEQRSSAEAALLGHIHDVGRLFNEMNNEGSLYLSGSLARGEPSWEFRNGRAIRLRSDLDWVIVDRDIRPGVDREFEAVIAKRFPGYADTVYRLPSGRISDLHSASTRDLRLGLQCPVVDRGICPAWPVFPIRAVHGLEVVVYYIVAMMRFHQESGAGEPALGMWTRDWAVAETKLVVETLRMASIASKSASLPGTYAAAFWDACDGTTNNLMPSDEVRVHLRYRESGGGSPPKVVTNLGCLVSQGIARIFDVHVATPKDLLFFVRDNVLCTDHILHRFPIVVLAALFVSKEVCDRGVLADLFQGNGRLSADPVSWVRDHRWQYISSLLAAKDTGVQLDALT